MKFLVVFYALTLVGSCATMRYTEKIEAIKDGIIFENPEAVKEFSNTITAEELKKHVYKIASDEFEGREVGEAGHQKTVDYLTDYYINEGIKSPITEGTYLQTIPEDYFSGDVKKSHNVISFIKGSKYPEEVVIISAHSDHIGKQGDTIYNGADDNGSGTSAIMEIAQAFKLAKEAGFGPKRSIAFMHLTGEEIGLTGSRYFVNNPLFPLEQAVANLNIDMIGRVDKRHLENPNYIYIIGADRLSTELHYISEVANNEFVNLDLDYRFNGENESNRYYYRSDHYNFARENIPVIFYFNGEHKDYHKETDTADKLNYDLLATRAKLIFVTAWYLANSEERIIADKADL